MPFQLGGRPGEAAGGWARPVWGSGRAVGLAQLHPQMGRASVGVPPPLLLRWQKHSTKGMERWAALRADGMFPPNTDEDQVTSIAANYTTGTNGAKQVAGLANMDLMEFAVRTAFSLGGRGNTQPEIPLSQRVEALFGVIAANVCHLLVSEAAAVRAAAFVRSLEEIEASIRLFFSQNSKLVKEDVFKQSFVELFGEGMRAWEGAVAILGTSLLSAAEIPDVRVMEFYAIPQPAFAQLLRFMESAPYAIAIHTVAATGGHGGGGGGSRGGLEQSDRGGSVGGVEAVV